MVTCVIIDGLCSCIVLWVTNLSLPLSLSLSPSPSFPLQGRLFSYVDTHRHRLGANYHQIPVNCPFAARSRHYQRDGPMAMDDNQGWGGGGGGRGHNQILPGWGEIRLNPPVRFSGLCTKLKLLNPFLPACDHLTLTVHSVNLISFFPCNIILFLPIYISNLFVLFLCVHTPFLLNRRGSKLFPQQFLWPTRQPFMYHLQNYCDWLLTND